MAQKAITIFTPSTTAPHIYAEDDAQVHRAILGGTGIAESDDKLALTQAGANLVRMQSGMFSNQGYLVCVQSGTTEDFTIEAGTQAMFRKDLIIAEFTRGGGSVADTHVFRVLKGTSAATEAGAQPPALTQNDLTTGGAVRQEPVYQIAISGTSIASITRVAAMVGSFYR